jgi:hypothetical protein
MIESVDSDKSMNHGINDGALRDKLNQTKSACKKLRHI